MLIIADENIPAAQEAFASLGEVITLHGRSMQASDVKDADVLLVRSITKVNDVLLDGSNVRFVGSATIGTDHVDLDWLAQNNIQFVNAPGCNATSASEYVIASLLHVAERRGLDLAGKTAGIIGCGNVGSRVQARLEALGIECIICDPPRAEKEGSDGFFEQSDIANADIVSVHVPLVRQGKHATRGLISADFIQSLKPGSIFINTSRGDVLDELAMLQRLRQQDDLSVVLDVWENEPLISPEMVDAVDIATPHIAGYSIDGKLRATQTLHDGLNQFLGQSSMWSADALLPTPKQPVVKLEDTDSRIAAVSQLLPHVFNVMLDDENLRHSMSTDDRGVAFDLLRKEYRPRRECSAYQIAGTGINQQIQSVLSTFGFQTS